MRRPPDSPTDEVQMGRCPELDHDRVFVFDRCATCQGTGLIELHDWDDKDREVLRARFAGHLAHALARELRRPVADVLAQARSMNLEYRGPDPAPFVVVRPGDNPAFGRRAR